MSDPVQDVLNAIMAQLTADAGINALIGQRVYLRRTAPLHPGKVPCLLVYPVKEINDFDELGDGAEEERGLIFAAAPLVANEVPAESQLLALKKAVHAALTSDSNLGGSADYLEYLETDWAPPEWKPSTDFALCRCAYQAHYSG